jgi:hypothetical protein
MSLKAFHIFFIVTSILLSVALGVWGVDDFRRSRSLVHLALGVASFIGSGVLASYGVWFLRKLKNVGYL